MDRTRLQEALFCLRMAERLVKEARTHVEYAKLSPTETHDIVQGCCAAHVGVKGSADNISWILSP